MIVPAEAVTWPGDKRAAASFTFDVDAESAVLAASPHAADRMGVMSQQAYGPLVGVPRILAMLRRHGIRSTFFVPGYTAERYPDVIRAIADDGHEVAHHGYMHEPLTGTNRETEASYLDRGLEALDRVAGVRPFGYRAPMWELTYESPDLLHERGFLYDSSLMDSDYPYELSVTQGDQKNAGSLVEIPVQWALDDWEQYCFIPGISDAVPIESPTKVLDMWSMEFEATIDIGGCFVLTNHPFLSGRPSRARALEQLVRTAVEDPEVWVAPLAEVATHVRSLSLPARSLPRPVM